MKNMGNYHENYLKKDVLLLADVFQKFISTCLKFYAIDPWHYFSSPGLRWDAMLKMTGIKLGKICGIDKYLFIAKGLRGGISYIAKRYAKADNKYMNYYDPKTVKICIIPWREEFIWLGNEWVSSLWGVWMVKECW